jgi:hypothetical protein
MFVYHVIIKTKVILPGAYVTLSVFVYPVIIKTKVILPGAYVTLSVFVYHVIIKTKVLLPGTISHFCGTDFFFLIMNKQEYNELNLIISYVALLVGNGD